jgi:hypothetical protein
MFTCCSPQILYLSDNAHLQEVDLENSRFCYCDLCAMHAGSSAYKGRPIMEHASHLVQTIRYPSQQWYTLRRQDRAHVAVSWSALPSSQW